ncbi:MAG: OmpH family outer membrane protein [Desulfovibrio sp.]|jgi:outer membrane protein|nr:OmpH family outer membrane protein [Desulfovibrio sp.]
MQMRHFGVALLALFLSLPVLTGFFGSSSKLAVVDMQRIMRDSEPARTGVKFLEDMHAGLQEKIKAIEARLEKDPQDADAQKELQTVYMNSQQRMQVEQQNVVTLLYDAIQRVMNTYREQNGYDVILNAEVAASFAPALDVTTAVLAEVNKQKVEFKPVFKEAATPKPEEKSDAGGDVKPADKNGGEKKQ